MHLRLRAQRALRSEHAEDDQDQPHNDETQRPGLARRQRQGKKTQALGQRTQRDRTPHAPPIAGETAENERRIAEESEARIEFTWIEISDIESKEEPRDSGKRSRNGKRLQLESEHIFAERSRSVLVFAYRFQDPPPWASLQDFESGKANQQCPPNGDQQRKLNCPAQAEWRKLA